MVAPALAVNVRRYHGIVITLPVATSGFGELPSPKPD